MSNNPFEPIKINLVEQPLWQKHFLDPMLDASDAAWQDFDNMSARDMESLIDDLWSAKPRKGRATKKTLTSEETEFLAQQLKERNDHLLPAKQAIQEAGTWMYQEAANPTTNDIQDAMEKAAEDIQGNDDLSYDLWDQVLGNEDVPRGPKEWSPRKKYTATEIWKQLLGQVSLGRVKGQWDGNLVFRFWEAEVSNKLFSIYKGRPEIYKRMNAEFEWLAKRYTEKTIYNVIEIMEKIDLSNRTNWKQSWNLLLGCCVEPEVRQGMVEALKEMPKEMPDA